MKSYLIAAVAFSLAITSCQKNKEVTISGKISNCDAIPLILTGFDYSKIESSDTIFITEGKFSKTLQIDRPVLCYLIYGDNMYKELFLKPGYSIQISFDTRNIDSSFKFEGRGANENSILDSLAKSFKKIDFNVINSQDAVLASEYVDSTYKAGSKYLNELIMDGQIEETFKEYVKVNLNYGFAALKIFIRSKVDKDTSFYRSMDQLMVENKKYLDIESYRQFLDSYISMKVEEKRTTIDSANIGTPGFYIDETLRLIENFKNEKIVDYLIFSSLYRHLEHNGLKDFDKYYDYFKKNVTDSVYANQLERLYNKKMQLAPGRQAPDFTCFDANGNEISLGDFIGKYIYIDFWATWCAPCRQELPYYLKLQSDYEGKNLVFVSISLDEDKNSWENFLKENNQEGISLFGGKGWGSDVAKAYQVSGVPTFVLIDKEGKLIDSDAPRPSSKEIRTILDEHLSQAI